jgi:hypothetical protein
MKLLIDSTLQDQYFLRRLLFSLLLTNLMDFISISSQELDYFKKITSLCFVRSR